MAPLTSSAVHGCPPDTLRHIERSFDNGVRPLLAARLRPSHGRPPATCLRRRRDHRPRPDDRSHRRDRCRDDRRGPRRRMGNVRRAKARSRAARASSDGGARSIHFPIRRRPSGTSRSSWRGDWRAASSSRTTRASTTRSSKPSSRAGIAFDAPVLCTVMLSRRLYPSDPSHDLDALIGRHGLAACERHRALPDARSLSACWFAMEREQGRARIADAVAELLAGPVMPAHLDRALIDRLPESPGVYVFHGIDGEILRIGEARNLRWHLSDYFRLDRASAQAMAISHRIEKITWRLTQGMLGARLQRIAFESTTSAGRNAGRRQALSWRATRDRYPSLELVATGGGTLSDGSELFGIFDSERKARNALLRLSRQHALCHAMLGIAQSPRGRACSVRRCSRGVRR